MSFKKIIYALLIIFNVILLSQSTSANYQTVVVEEDDKLLILSATPVVAKIWQEEHPPVLVTFSPPLQKHELALVKKLTTNRCLFIKSPSDFKKDKLEDIPTTTLEVSPMPLEAAITIAQNFWPKTEKIVVAPIGDTKALIHGCTLATHLGVPFIPVEDTAREVKRSFAKLVRDLKVKQIVTCANKNLPRWLDKYAKKRLDFNSKEVQSFILQHIGKSNVRNVVLTRATKDESKQEEGIWLAPYYSFLRKSPIVIVNSPKGQAAEKKVYKFIKSHSISPRSLTILANHASIRSIKLNDPKILGEYKLKVEPCAAPPKNYATALAVGRIPSDSLRDISLLLARNITRSYTLESKRKRLLMVANPHHGGELVLAETVARATVKEFRNCRIKVDEFYQKEADSKKVLKAADKAHLIIFQGHIGDQEIFPQQGKKRFKTRNLKGQALVILQSCHSLEEPTAQTIFKSGGVGLIGSVTRIHSASGSSFIKTYCDHLLYHGATVGEALRNARNFFLCLAQLKVKRGHKETAKVNRVALSFRLWGDPELELFSSLKKPKRKTIKAKFVGNNKIVITAPKRRLPKVATDKYFTRMFPGSAMAGLVKRIKNKDYRRIMMLYFFRLPVPKDFPDEDFKQIWRMEHEDYRTVFMKGLYNKYIYVLYFPKKVINKEKIELVFF